MDPRFRQRRSHLRRASGQPREPGPSAALAAAEKLRTIVLAREDGAYIGSQDELIEMLGVGRVTLQQTARILEQERLLRVRRGVNGGYYGTRPDEAGVEQAVAVYLRANNAGFAEALQVSGALAAEMLRLAALSDDVEAREELRKVGEAIERPEVLADRQRLVAAEDAFYDAVYKLAANPLGELMMRVTSRMFFIQGDLSLLPSPEDRLNWQRTRKNMVRAILEHDADYVQILNRRFVRDLQAALPSEDGAEPGLARSS